MVLTNNFVKVKKLRISTLAFRSVTARKIRSSLTLIGIAIGVALIFAVAITNQAIINSFLDVVADLSGAADLQITDVSTGPFDETALKEVAATPGVGLAAPSVSRRTVANYERDTAYLRIVGVDVAKEKGFRRYRIINGRFLSAKRAGIVLVKSWAAERHLKLGDKIKLAGIGGTRDFRIVGLMAKVGPGAADNGSVGFINLRSAQSLYGLKGKLSQVDVKIETGQKPGIIAKRLRKKLGDGFDPRRPVEKGKSIEAVTGTVMGAFGSFGSLALFIGAFVVFNTMMMSVAERRREIGILRLTGATRTQILWVILMESAFFGLVGSALGLFLGRVLAQGLTEQVAAIYHISVTKISAPAAWMAAAFGIGVAVSVIAGFQPAWKAGSVTPIEGVRREQAETISWLERFGWLPGIVLIAAALALFSSPLKIDYGTTVFDIGAALIFLGVALFSVILVTALVRILAPLIKSIFGNEGRLAIDSIYRGKTRTALAVVTLLVSLSMIIASGELRLADNAFLENWIAAVLPFDISVRTPLPLSTEDINKYTPVDFKLKKQIVKVKGVASVTPIKFVLARGFGRTLFVISVEGESWKKTSKLVFEEGDRDRALKDFDRGGQVLISSTITSKKNVHAGQEIKLKTPSGTRSFRVTGVFPEVANDGYTIYISRRDQIKFWKDSSTDGFNIVLRKGATLTATMNQLEKLIGNTSGLSVISGSDIRNEIRKSVNQFLSILDALVLLAIVVTGLGIVNTLAMSVLERVREIGILRAVGSSRWQISKMILAEAGTIGVIGAILGGIVGLVVAWQIVIISHLVGGWRIPFVFPARYLIGAAFMAIFISMFSSVYPALKAAGVDIVKAVQWE